MEEDIFNDFDPNHDYVTDVEKLETEIEITDSEETDNYYEKK